MRFVDPQFLYGLVLLPLYYGFLAWDRHRKRARFEKFADPVVWQKIAPELDWGVRLRKGRLWVLAMFFAFFALARPQWGMHEEVTKVTGLDIMVAIDVSNSMLAEDVVPSRLKKARHVLKTLTERLAGDRVGVVAFAASSWVACPLTTDLDYVRETLDIVDPTMVSNQGSDLGIALETAERAMARAAEEGEDKSKAKEEKGASRVVILITDGEDHEDQAAAAAKKIKEGGSKLYVLGVGSEAGGQIPVRDERGQLHGYKRSRTGEAVVTKANLTSLQKIASAGGGRYWTVTSSEGEIDEILSDMGALDRSGLSERRFTVHHDRFQIPLALAVLLILIELSLPARRLVAFLLLILFPLTNAQAAPLESWLDTREGVKAWREERLDDAKRNFGASQARDPNGPENQFNTGTVQLKEGDVEGAIQGFAGAARGAAERKDPRLAGEALFNLGAALNKKGDHAGAVQSYLGAIDAAHAAKDKQLEEDARKNLELLIVQRQQQKQKQKDDKDKDQKDSKQDPQQKQGDPQQKQDEKQQQQAQQEKKKEEGGDKQEKKDDKGKDQNEKEGSQGKDEKEAKEGKRYEDPSKSREKFKSQKLSGEDADRVMAELSNRERDLQGKLKRQKGQPQAAGKDW